MTAALALSEEVRVRPGEADDVRFILSSWLESYRRSEDHIPGPVYYRFQRDLCARLLERGELLVACDPEHPEQILGWVLAESRGGVRVLHYLYVKAPFRRMGVASMLLAATGARDCHYTHHTHAGLRLARAWGAHFNPYLRSPQ